MSFTTISNHKNLRWVNRDEIKDKDIQTIKDEVMIMIVWPLVAFPRRSHSIDDRSD